MLKKFGSVFLIGSLLLVTACGSGGGSTSEDGGGGGNPGGLKENVNHIVFMFQENRSFDSYFGKLNDYRIAHGFGADVDGLDKVSPQPPSNPTRDGSGFVNVFEFVSQCHENVSPGWNESHTQRNRDNPTITNPPLMDGFVHTAAGFAINNGFTDVEGLRAMGFYDDTHLPYYYFMATQFATGDRFFSPVMAKTEPNRLFSLAATSAGNITVQSAPLSQKTIFHLLEEKGISWKIYTTDTGAGATFMSAFQPFARDHADKIVPLSQYFTDLNSDTLPAVALIESGYRSGLDEHPNNKIQEGAAHVKRIIDALMQSSSWTDSVFILTYDEGGGVYDHVPPAAAVSPDGIPPILTPENPNTFGDNFTMTGFRVPLLVVSPFTKKGFVSHTTMDFTAILKFIETRHDLPNLTARDAAQPDMTEFFDFAGKPWATPPTGIPDQPRDAPCYYTRLP